MADAREEQTQLATRVPKELHRRLKLYCVEAEVALMDFVTQAIRESLARKGRPARRRRGAAA